MPKRGTLRPKLEIFWAAAVPGDGVNGIGPELVPLAEAAGEDPAGEPTLVASPSAADVEAGARMVLEPIVVSMTLEPEEIVDTIGTVETGSEDGGTTGATPLAPPAPLSLLVPAEPLVVGTPPSLPAPALDAPAGAATGAPDGD